MKKKLLLSVVLFSLILSGCGSADSEYLYDAADFNDYTNYRNQGKLNAMGYYIPEAYQKEIHPTLPEERSENSVRFVLAQNNKTDFHLYRDKGHKLKLSSNEFYLKPGDKLYVTAENAREVSGDHIFKAVRLVAFDDNKQGDAAEYIPDSSGLLLQITGEMAGHDYIIYPIGGYTTRKVNFSDIYVDERGSKFKAEGQWFLDSNQITGNTVDLDPLTSHIISYRFDKDKYFFTGSNPKALYVSNEEGLVVFDEENSFDNSSEYFIELKKFFSVSVKTSDTRLVRCNGGADQKVRSGKNFIVNNLKYGDQVTIITNKRWPELEECDRLKGPMPEEQGPASYRYVLTACQPGSVFEFNPSEFKYKRGKLVFNVFGEDVASTKYLAPGTKIYFRQKSAEEGYSLALGGGFITVTDSETTAEELKNIKYIRSVPVTVLLPQAPYGGTIEYYIENRKLYEDTYETTGGNSIEIKYIPDEGWTVNENCINRYTVTDGKFQTLTMGVESYEDIFAELDGHMPKLRVTLDKNVGIDTYFTVRAAGKNVVQNANLDSGVSRSGKSLIVEENTRIPTRTNPEITVTGLALPDNKALKFSVELIGKNKGETFKYYILKRDFSSPVTINVYDYPGVEKSIWFDSVKINVEMVDVQAVYIPKAGSNFVIELRNLYNGTALNSGDLIEPTEEVLVSIIPSEGYKLTGSGIKDGKYSWNMKYGNYIDDISGIISTHPVVEDNDTSGGN